MQDTRKEKILKLVVESYIKNAEPVGSKFLVDVCGLEVSGATIRNEMRDLEEAGYLTHPHTSSGRIPTEAGYQYYIKNIMKPKLVSKKIKNNLEDLLNSEGDQVSLKKIGKLVAELTNSAVIISFGDSQVYYTGISNLFSQPEFQDYSRVINFSAIFDEYEENVEDLSNLISETTVLVGQNNPLGTSCSLVGIKFGDNLLTIMGPMRMDYNANVGLVDHIRRLF